ncbi:hypothetical protein H0O03_02985 [Candidatus Micrarchaeota archaeon]|nr:hypothetical protein [Candidatus Micrarchaeota archaeon]
MASLIVKSAVAEFLKKKGMRCSTELYAALDKAVAAKLDRALERAKKNKRSTVMEQDL